MFQVIPVGDTIWRVIYNPTNTLAGYVRLVIVHGETRYKAQLIRHGRLGASLGEHPTLEEAAEAFTVLQPSLDRGEITFDNEERWNRRRPKTGIPQTGRIKSGESPRNGATSRQRKSWYTGDPASDTSVRYD